MSNIIDYVKYLVSDYLEAKEDEIHIRLDLCTIRDLLAMCDLLREKLQAAEVLAAQLQMRLNLVPVIDKIVVTENVDDLKREITRLESLAASRLVDQEAIEKHTRRITAEECLVMHCRMGQAEQPIRRT